MKFSRYKFSIRESLMSVSNRDNNKCSSMRSTVVLFIGMGFGFMDVVGLVVRKEGETLNLIS